MRIALLFVLPACSLVAVQGPPTVKTAYVEPRCTEVPVVPVIDAVVAGALGYLAYQQHLAANAPESPPDDDSFHFDLGPSHETMSGVFLASSVITMVSAIYGVATVVRCHRAKNEFARTNGTWQ